MRKLWVALVAAFVMLSPVGAMAQERSASRPGFTFPTDKPVTVVVLRPDVSVGSMGTSNINTPNADWTANARKEIADALRRNDQVSGAKLVFQDNDFDGDDGAYMAEYRSLFSTVAGSIQTGRLFVGSRLPTKKGQFDWSLGEGTQRLAKLTGADYALFVYTLDSYSTAGRKTAAVFMALLGGPIMPTVHIGYAGLIDLKTGDVIWLNADPQMGGDVRTAEGADKRVRQLLDGLPGRVAPPAPAPEPKK